MRDGDESARAAAERELGEETGLNVALTWAGIAEFDLVGPARRERAAVYVATAAGSLTWSTASSPSSHGSPRTAHRQPGRPVGLGDRGVGARVTAGLSASRA